MTPSREYLPPAAEADPYRGDPRESSPFPTEGAAPAALPVDPHLPPIRVGARVEPPREGPPQFYKSGEAPSAAIPPRPKTQDEQSAERYGKFAFGFGIASLVINPIFSPIAIVLGVIAMRRGQERLGRWAIGTGVAGLVIGTILVVLVSAGVINVDEMYQQMLDEFRSSR